MFAHQRNSPPLRAVRHISCLIQRCQLALILASPSTLILNPFLWGCNIDGICSYTQPNLNCNAERSPCVASNPSWPPSVAIGVNANREQAACPPSLPKILSPCLSSCSSRAGFAVKQSLASATDTRAADAYRKGVPPLFGCPSLIHLDLWNSQCMCRLPVGSDHSHIMSTQVSGFETLPYL